MVKTFSGLQHMSPFGHCIPGSIVQATLCSPLQCQLLLRVALRLLVYLRKFFLETLRRPAPQVGAEFTLENRALGRLQQPNIWEVVNRF